jgi:predicted MPP superfamily phosphohydrolase
MPIVPILVFSALTHLLVGWLIAPDLFTTSPSLAWLFWTWAVVSMAVMPMGLVTPGFAGARTKTALTWLGLLLMGLFSSVFVLAVLRELVLGVLTLAQWLGVTANALPTIRQETALLVAPLALLMTAAGFWNARRTATVIHVDVPIANLPASMEGFQIAQISDIHVGPTIKARYLQRIVDRVNLLKADLVAITGDLVDGPVKSVGAQIAPLLDLRSSYGTYFVTGNHEYYSGAHGWIDKLRTMGITVLMNEHVVIDHSTDTQAADSATIVVAGVADYSAHHFDERHRSDPHAAMADAPEHAHVKLLLAHQPRSAGAAAAAGFDLQLSGHTHGGQFWPWGYFVKFQQPFTAGLHKLDKLWVYTSRGTGYWGPPKRFGAPSEITCLRLVRA